MKRDHEHKKTNLNKTVLQRRLANVIQGDMGFIYSTAAAAVFAETGALQSAAKKLPSKASVADAIMIFTCSPEDAEVAVGDLLEKFATVSERHSKTVSNLWFVWELSLMGIAKLRKRLVKATLGPLLDKWFKPKI